MYHYYLWAEGFVNPYILLHEKKFSEEELEELRNNALKKAGDMRSVCDYLVREYSFVRSTFGGSTHVKFPKQET